MDKDLMLLILDDKEQTTDRRLATRIDRSRATTAVATTGAKIRHDSGGRLLVVDVAKEGQEAMARLLPGARLVPINEEVKKMVKDLDPTESLFLDALIIRSSKAYREAKRSRKYGESPEEKQLTSGSCVRDTY